jgi:hypothetical protein
MVRLPSRRGGATSMQQGYQNLESLRRIQTTASNRLLACYEKLIYTFKKLYAGIKRSTNHKKSPNIE